MKLIVGNGACLCSTMWNTLLMIKGRFCSIYLTNTKNVALYTFGTDHFRIKYILFYLFTFLGGEGRFTFLYKARVFCETQLYGTSDKKQSVTPGWSRYET